MTKCDSTAQKPTKQVKNNKFGIYNAEQFIAKAKEVHGGVFVYEDIKFVSLNKSVVITCKAHGRFIQRAVSHIKGSGCSACSKCKKMDKAAFVKKAKLVHKGCYTYDKVKYKNTKTKICITCPSHGDFWQQAGSHLAGCKCPSCYQESKFLTQDEFIKRSKEAHGDEGFDYSEVTYTGSRDRVKLTCNTCQDTFYQIADGHMRGLGCGNCAGTKKVTQDDYIAQAKEKYGNRFDYSQVELISKSEKIKIICKLHGVFEQSAYYHLVSDGCPKCSQAMQGYTKTNFADQCKKNNNGNGTLYVIQCQKENESFFKIGRTSNSVEARYPSKMHMPYDYETTYLITGDSDYIYDLENKLHALMTEHNYSPIEPFSGQTECFTTIKPIEQLLKRLTSTEQLQLIA